RPSNIDGLRVDSAIDIAVNKVFTIAQNPRGRDYFDLFSLINKYNYSLDDLRMKAKVKFDWHVDPLQLATRLFEVDTHLDDPILIKKISQKEIIRFFKDEAIKMSPQILSK